MSTPEDSAGAQQTALTDYPSQTTRAGWEPESSDVRRCQNCQRQVTGQFARTMGDNNDTVHHCVHCVPNGALDRGAAAQPDYQPEYTREDNHD